MKLARMLSKILVRPFFKVNAGLFLFLFLLLFGIVSPAGLITYHVSLAKGILQYPAALSVVMVLWLLYNLKCVRFIRQTSEDPAYRFLCNLQAVNRRKLFLLLLAVHLQLCLPPLLYLLFVTAVAVCTGNILAAGICVLLLVLLPLLATACHVHTLHASAKNTSFIIPQKFSRFSISGKISFHGCLLSYVFHQRSFLLLVIKVVSLALLYTALVLNTSPDFRQELLMIFLPLILSAHAILVYYQVTFFESRLSFTRNLPLTFAGTAVMFIYPGLILLLPELVFLIIRAQPVISLPIAFLMYLVMAGQLFLSVSMLYCLRLRIRPYIKLTGVLLFLNLLFLRFDHLPAYFVVECLLAVFLFRTGFYRYEPAPSH